MYKTTMNNILVKLRKNAGLTQQQAAEGINVSRSLYVKLERGERRLNEDHYQKLASLYGIDESEIINGSSEINIDRLTASKIPDGRIVHTLNLNEPTPIVDETLVAATVGNNPVDLYKISSIENMDVFYPIDFQGNRGAAVSYAEGAEWHTGTALLDGQACTYHIIGVVRWISIPCT